MFEKGDYIVYGTTGVCQIEDITTMDPLQTGTGRFFYVLVPSSQKGGKIFTPTDSTKNYMRKVLNHDEAEQLIREIPDIKELWIANEKQREDLYKTCMKSGDCRQWIRIIKTLYLRKLQRNAQGKRITAVDEKYLRMAEDCLYSELSAALGLPKEQMADYIGERIEELK